MLAETAARYEGGQVSAAVEAGQGNVLDAASLSADMWHQALHSSHLLHE